MFRTRSFLNPRQFGPYAVEAAIGAGGMGEVFRAKDTRLRPTVAIKGSPEKVELHSEGPTLLDRSTLRDRKWSKRVD